MGLAVESAGALAGYDFLVGGRVRIAVRVAFPSTSRRRAKVGRRRCEYVYRAWTFNFHRHGVVGDRYCEFFVCAPLGAGKPFDPVDAFVIPWEALTGKTFYLQESRREYRGKFRVYRNAWENIAAAVRCGRLDSRAA